MRIANCIVVAAVIVLSQPVAAEALYGLEKRGSGWGDVDIQVARTLEFHPRRDEIREVCRAGYEVKGCTDFPVETLECHCDRRGDAWVISVSARLEAVVHLLKSHENMKSLVHEGLHMQDLRTGLQSHLESLASRRYESVTTCRRFAEFLSTSSHLRVVMNRLRVESNAKLGCSRGAR